MVLWIYISTVVVNADKSINRSDNETAFERIRVLTKCGDSLKLHVHRSRKSTTIAI